MRFPVGLMLTLRDSLLNRRFELRLEGSICPLKLISRLYSCRLMSSRFYCSFSRHAKYCESCTSSQHFSRTIFSTDFSRRINFSFCVCVYNFFKLKRYCVSYFLLSNLVQIWYRISDTEGWKPVQFDCILIISNT